MLYLDFMYNGLARGGLRMQQVKKNYTKAAELLIELASLQTSFVTLDDVIKMTNRRVNAIEQGTINATAISFFLTLEQHRVAEGMQLYYCNMQFIARVLPSVLSVPHCGLSCGSASSRNRPEVKGQSSDRITARSSELGTASVLDED